MMDLYQQYIHQSRYARWIPEKGRRETWEETVTRYIDYIGDQWRKTDADSCATLNELHKAILDLEVMPSMRALMTAGPALDRDNVAGFNCAYTTIDHPRAFDEILYILMCGTGVGFSVEEQYTSKLPEVAEAFHETDTIIRVHDSKIGWAKSFRELLALLWQGQIPRWDLSAIRPAGSPLKTFGGRASGPGPLGDLFAYSVQVFKGARGRRLSTLEVHDLVCKIADVVVVGGVRRSALISLSDLEDSKMRHCKSGNWWATHPHRALANNSAVYKGTEDFETFLSEWTSLYESKAGERGIFSRRASRDQAAANGRREDADFGTNPCSEIILRPQQFCNLTEVVVRADDSREELKYKVKLATILGTIQSTLTDFRYLRSIWKRNTEEERLLGVSLTGIMDHSVLNGSMGEYLLMEYLTEMREVAVETNKELAELMGIPQSAAITCVKPSGTVSQLTNSASGIHPRFSSYYIRRVRGDKKDPLSQILINSGVPCEDDLMNPSAYVFSFPIEAPARSQTVDEVEAMDQLNLWYSYQEYWCEHKPSCTVYYQDHEFLQVGQWIWDNLNRISGLSFMPQSDHVYRQAPYEKISRDQWVDLSIQMPEAIDWFSVKEDSDMTTGSQELACKGGVCEI